MMMMMMMMMVVVVVVVVVVTKGSDNCLLTVPGDRTNPIHAIGSQDASTNNTSTEQIL